MDARVSSEMGLKGRYPAQLPVRWTRRPNVALAGRTLAENGDHGACNEGQNLVRPSCRAISARQGVRGLESSLAAAVFGGPNGLPRNIIAIDATWLRQGGVKEAQCYADS